MLSRANCQDHLQPDWIGILFLRIDFQDAFFRGRSRSHGLPAAQKTPEKTIGIQVGSVSFVDEGVDRVLDNLQEKGAVNTIFLNTFGWDRGLNGRQIYGQPFPDHGVQDYDLDLVGGNYATPHPQYYANTILKETKSPDYGDLDILELVLPKAKERGMKVYAACIDSFRGSVPNIQKLSEVDMLGNRVGAFCNLNPDWRNFVIGLVEDTCKSYDIDGVLWFAERNGPLLNAIGASHAARINPSRATCFCEFHQAAAEDLGIDIQRARGGTKSWRALFYRPLLVTDPMMVTSSSFSDSFWKILRSWLGKNSGPRASSNSLAMSMGPPRAVPAVRAMASLQTSGAA